jgi:hypothetical protein
MFPSSWRDTRAMANTVTVADDPASGSLSVIDHFHVRRPHATRISAGDIETKPLPMREPDH